MKQLILILSLACLFTAASAQTQGAKPPAAPKPAPYSPDVSKKVDLTLKAFTVQELNDFLIYQQRGAQFDESTDISVKQAKIITANAIKVTRSVYDEFNKIMAADKLKWQADSVKAANKAGSNK